MKKIVLVLFGLVYVGFVQAQCDKMFDYKNGTTWEFSNFDKKGKLIDKTIQKVEKIEVSSNSAALTMAVSRVSEDGETLPPMSFDMSCKDGVIYMDMKKFIPDQYINEEDEETSISIDGTNLEMPYNMKAGDVLKDASVTMKIGDPSSPLAISMKVDIINRKVEAEEALTTPAGDFDCVVLTQTVKTKIMVSFVADTKEWYAQGVGVVKSESYRKGKLIGYTMLTAFNK